MIAAAEGGPEKKLPPGAYEYQPHSVKHVTKCDTGGVLLGYDLAEKEPAPSRRVPVVIESRSQQ